MPVMYGHIIIIIIIVTTIPTTIRNFLISLYFHLLIKSFILWSFITTFAQLGHMYFFVTDGNNGLGSAFCYSSANLE